MMIAEPPPPLRRRSRTASPPPAGALFVPLDGGGALKAAPASAAPSLPPEPAAAAAAGGRRSSSALRAALRAPLSARVATVSGVSTTMKSPSEDSEPTGAASAYSIRTPALAMRTGVMVDAEPFLPVR